MSRPVENQSVVEAGPSEPCDTQIAERARVAAQIVAQVLKLIEIARAAGLTTLTHLLEAAVLEAASHAASQWPVDSK